MLCPASCSCVFIELSSLQRHALRFIEERDRCFESEKQAQAIERIVPRAFARNYYKMVRSLVKEGPTMILS